MFHEIFYKSLNFQNITFNLSIPDINVLQKSEDQPDMFRGLDS